MIANGVDWEVCHFELRDVRLILKLVCVNFVNYVRITEAKAAVSEHSVVYYRTTTVVSSLIPLNSNAGLCRGDPLWLGRGYRINTSVKHNFVRVFALSIEVNCSVSESILLTRNYARHSEPQDLGPITAIPYYCESATPRQVSFDHIASHWKFIVGLYIPLNNEVGAC